MTSERITDEFSIIQSAQKGDADAMQRIIHRYYPLICSLSKRIQCLYIEKEVLIQAGIIGLMQAVSHYQSEHGAKLHTYAVPWILGEMKRALKEETIQSGLLSLERERQEDGSCLKDKLPGAEDINISAIDLHIAFEKLNKEAQILLILRYFTDKTQKETAKLLKRSQTQISRMERKALDTLHDLLL